MNAPAPTTDLIERPITYRPLGASEDITLTINMVRKFLCVPTKKGILPSDADVVRYMMLCKANGLDPWTADCWLLGYDDDRKGPTFSLITSHQSFLKRAEASPDYDGMESGVIVFRGENPEEATDENTVLREGDFVHANEILLGGWARVYRKGRSRPSTDRIHRGVFDTGKSRWAIDPAGMIVKVAEQSAMRKAFPSTLSGLYCREEMDRLLDAGKRSVESVEASAASAAAFGAGATAATTTRPGSGDDVRPCLPPRLMQSTDDDRPLSQYLLDTIATAPVQDVDYIAAALGSLRLKRDEVQTVVQALGERRDVLAREPEPERGEPGGELEPETLPVRPEEVERVLAAIRAAKTETGLGMVEITWGKLAGEHPDFAEVVAAAIAKRKTQVKAAGK